jgi:4-diphosphocytidyl-2-C-methyl-D-erythritol kinase
MVASPGDLGRRPLSSREATSGEAPLRDWRLDDPRVRSSSATRVAGVAPAKLNLFLEVLRKRDDGYHELRTLFHEVDLADEVELELAPAASSDSLELHGLALDVPSDRNLALRAAAAFRRHVAPAPPIAVQLTKVVPPGSGMGGGSSDAAFVLAALARLVAPDADAARMRAAAREVGADVGFFLVGGTALGSGRGEELRTGPRVLPKTFALVLPRFGVATAEVYAHVDLIAPRMDVSSRLAEVGTKSRFFGFNRLEEAAARVEPRLAALLGELRSITDATWSMTGSGSALYRPMSSEEEAISLTERVTSRLGVDSRIVHSFEVHRGRDAPRHD